MVSHVSVRFMASKREAVIKHCCMLSVLMCSAASLVEDR